MNHPPEQSPIGLVRRPYHEVKEDYRRTHPLYDAYWAFIEQYSRDVPITQPATQGIDPREAVAAALIHIGKPCDRLTIDMAYAYIRRLDQEISDSSLPVEPTIETILIDYFFHDTYYIPTVEEWHSYEDYEQQTIVADLDIPPQVLPELLRLAMPTLLAHIITQDRQRRTQPTRPKLTVVDDTT